VNTSTQSHKIVPLPIAQKNLLKSVPISLPSFWLKISIFNPETNFSQNFYLQDMMVTSHLNTEWFYMKHYTVSEEKGLLANIKKIAINDNNQKGLVT